MFSIVYRVAFLLKKIVVCGQFLFTFLFFAEFSLVDSPGDFVLSFGLLEFFEVFVADLVVDFGKTVPEKAFCVLF